MLLRKYKSYDCEKIAELFYDTVHTVNTKDYTADQVDAWATGEIDFALWDKTLSRNYSIVAIKDDMVVGFGDIDMSGYLDRLYVHKDYQRQGIATAICDELENAVQVDRIITHSSITAVPFFLGRGYKIFKKQEVLRNAITLVNYVMEKR